jgi:hypothetical protein
MDPVKNPFSPGAGSPPPELVGRNSILDMAFTVPLFDEFMRRAIPEFQAR